MWHPELRRYVIPEPAGGIAGLVAPGLNTLAGDPRGGKSLLALGLAVAVATGGIALGDYVLDESETVLYYDLEQDIRISQSRAQLVAPDQDIHSLLYLWSGAVPPSWPERVAHLEQVLTEYKPAMIVLDTLDRFVGPKPPEATHNEFYRERCGIIDRLGLRYGCAIIAVVHTTAASARARDTNPVLSVSGGMGITSASSGGNLLLRREPSSPDAVLYVTGRTVLDNEIALRCVNGIWTVAQDMTAVQARYGGPQRLIIDYLTSHGASTSRSIVDDLGGNEQTLRTYLKRLRRDGIIDLDDGYYSIPDRTPPQNPDLSNIIWHETPPSESDPPPPDPDFPDTPGTPAQTPSNSQDEAWGPGTIGAEVNDQNPPSESEPPLPKPAETPLPAREVPSGTGTPHLDLTPLQAAQGMEPDAALQHVQKAAIPATMRLLDATRVTGRYTLYQNPSMPQILHKPGKRQANAIWNGSYTWTRDIPDGATVTHLDRNAAYLAAFKTYLPVGRLGHDEDLQRHSAGFVHTQWPTWNHPELPHPLGTRDDTSPVWIGTPKVRLWDELVAAGLAEPLDIDETWLCTGSEALLEGLRCELRDQRAAAIATSDILHYEYIKACYSKFISTCGESGSNWEMRRPDIQHLIYSQAYANLYRTARRLTTHGVNVVSIRHVDEIHVTEPPHGANWREVLREGTGLNEIKAKPVTDDARR